jgi:hypothetical protein
MSGRVCWRIFSVAAGAAARFGGDFFGADVVSSLATIDRCTLPARARLRNKRTPGAGLAILPPACYVAVQYTMPVHAIGALAHA